ncbi:sigma-54-dependent Fis family transcriptional regulator [Skermanella mucosa]|uniref:sigma-54-dependent Fis family transcriptional regulator n=1 Tax=Skermanella mucosa TaxID=1789672 RepID=UPI00192C092C|nr:sigma-54-dependent Fis family transcriptional regulator [Skermanella mucosa]UEM23797.1 sigma-54-dependent Fis family transcriptional regulator [Skermanella mucosa]
MVRLHAPEREHVDLILSSVTGAAAGREADPPDLIRRSWARCLNSHQLDPARPGRPVVLTQTELGGFREPMEEFIGIATAELRRLYAQVAGSDYVVMLTDANGIAVDYLGHASFEQELKQAGLYLGSIWSEAQEGTNGVGTCIATREPLTVHRQEHFRTRHTSLTCTVAPIFDPSGQMLGVLDVSNMTAPADRRSQMLALELVKRSARLMEDGYFLARSRRHWVVGLSAGRELADLVIDGLLAVDGGGTILGANQTALRAGLTGDAGPLLGRSLYELFGITMEALIGRQRTGIPQPLRCLATGATWYATLRPPTGRLLRGSAVGERPRREVPAPSLPGAVSGPLDLDRLAGNDPAMAGNVQRIRRVLDKGIGIMILGETGTGKEAVAQAIHRAGARAARPFVGINCAAIPESLIESELFGYAEGAFTGARRGGVRGKVQLADGGTLFLDEIGDMPLGAQTRLLRVLAEREILPLGHDRPIAVDLSVICATHQDLERLVADGRFREDLYYRLNGLSLTLPPLRDRSDKADLIRGVAAPARIDPPALSALLACRWPGNIRQLQNVMRVASALSEGGVIRLEDLPAEVTRPPAAPTPPDPLPSGEAGILLSVLRRHQWCVTRAADELHISRSTLHRKINRYGLVSPARLEG